MGVLGGVPPKIEMLLCHGFVMEFQEVNELVPGTKYRIVYSSFLIFRGVYSHTEDQVHIFKNVHGYGFCYEKPFAYFNKYYKPILGRIQQKMEERALQLILKNIIGDETFQW